MAVSQRECLAAAMRVLPKGVRPARGLQLGDGTAALRAWRARAACARAGGGRSCGHGERTGWDGVPPGCSMQSGGDWAVHFNRGAGWNSGKYSPVCGQKARRCAQRSGKTKITGCSSGGPSVQANNESPHQYSSARPNISESHSETPEH